MTSSNWPCTRLFCVYPAVLIDEYGPVCVACCGIWHPGPGALCTDDPLLRLWAEVGAYDRRFIQAMNQFRRDTGNWPRWLHPPQGTPKSWVYSGGGEFGNASFYGAT